MDDLFSSKWPATSDELPAFFQRYADVIFLDPSKFRIASLSEYMQLYASMHSSSITVRPIDADMRGMWRGEMTNLIVDVELGDTYATVQTDAPAHLDINLLKLRAHLEAFCKTGISHPQRRGVSSLCVNVRAPDVCRCTVFPGGVVRVQLHKNVRKTYWSALMCMEWFLQRLEECGAASEFYVHRLQIGNCGVIVSCRDVLQDLDSSALELFGRARGFLAASETAPGTSDGGSSSSSTNALTLAAHASAGTGSADAMPRRGTTWEQVALSYYSWYEARNANSIRLPAGKSLPPPPPHLTRRGIEGSRDEVSYVYTPIEPDDVFEHIATVVEARANAGDADMAAAKQLLIDAPYDAHYARIYQEETHRIEYAAFAANPTLFLRRVDATAMVDCFTPLFFEDAETTSVTFDCDADTGKLRDGLCGARTPAWASLGKLHAYLHMMNASEEHANAAGSDARPMVRVRPTSLALFKQASHADACHTRLQQWRPCIWKGALQSMHSKSTRVDGSTRDGILYAKNAAGKFIAATACGEYISHAIRARHTLTILRALLVELRHVVKHELRAYFARAGGGSRQERPARACVLESLVDYVNTRVFPAYETEIQWQSFLVADATGRHVRACTRELCIQIQREVAYNVAFELSKCYNASLKSHESHARSRVAPTCHCHDTSWDLPIARDELRTLRESDMWYEKCIVRQLSEISDHASASTSTTAQAVQRENNEREIVRRLCKINPHLNPKHDMSKFLQKDAKARKRRAPRTTSSNTANSTGSKSNGTSTPLRPPTMCMGTLLLMHLPLEQAAAASTAFSGIDGETDEESAAAAAAIESDMDACFHHILFESSRRAGPRGRLWDYISNWHAAPAPGMPAV